jgi:tetratricopeptide (TPR) repeat protein
MGLFGWFSKSAGNAPDGRLAEARSLAAAGKYQDALALYSKLNRRDRTPAVLVEMARAGLAAGKDWVALDYVNQALDEQPDYPPALSVQTEIRQKQAPRSSVALPPRVTGSDPEVSELNRRAIELYQQGQYEQAIGLATQARDLALLRHGESLTDYATSLNNLAAALLATNRLTEAEPLMRRALAIDEHSHGPDHPTVARDLNNLAVLLRDTNRPTEAEPLMRRALAIDEHSY